MYKRGESPLPPTKRKSEPNADYSSRTAYWLFSTHAQDMKEEIKERDSIIETKHGIKRNSGQESPRQVTEDEGRIKISNQEKVALFLNIWKSIESMKIWEGILDITIR